MFTLFALVIIMLSQLLGELQLAHISAHMCWTGGQSCSYCYLMVCPGTAGSGGRLINWSADWSGQDFFFFFGILTWSPSLDASAHDADCNKQIGLTSASVDAFMFAQRDAADECATTSCVFFHYYFFQRSLPQTFNLKKAECKVYLLEESELIHIFKFSNIRPTCSLKITISQ